MRRDDLIGHILKHEGSLKTITERYMDGILYRGRPTMMYVQHIISDMGCDRYQETKEKGYYLDPQ